MCRIKRRLLLLAVTGATACSMGALASAASAASGFGLDRTNPMTTGCSNSAITLSSSPVTESLFHPGATVATLQLRYSTVCGTKWARVVNSNLGSNPIEVYVTRDTPHQTTYLDGSDPGPFPGPTVYSDQLYGHGMRVCAYGVVFEGYIGTNPVWSNWGQVCSSY